MPRGTHSLRRARRAVATGALLVLALTGCAGTTAGSSGGAAPVAADSGSPVTVRSVSHASGSVRGGTVLTLAGTGMNIVHAVSVGGAAAPLRTRTDTKVTVRVPAAKDFRPGTAAIALRTESGEELAHGTFRYREVNGVDRELRYVLTYWKHYNPAYEALDDNDCVDFASQALLRRGWTQQDDWVHADAVLDSGAAWRSSTAFRDFMDEHPELGTPLTDSERSKVKLGDIVQFDWDRSGDRDHTGVVTRIVKQGGHIRIFFAGHTNDSDYRSVDTAITVDHPGGEAFYFSLK
ncbi:MAG: hypothetical protein QOE37_1481 [Microbacteriaceae bacterium]|jgi:hypothetical protein|nr:hypothetical protein [Microbacteriaceae bacterium]